MTFLSGLLRVTAEAVRTAELPAAEELQRDLDESVGIVIYELHGLRERLAEASKVNNTPRPVPRKPGPKPGPKPKDPPPPPSKGGRK